MAVVSPLSCQQKTLDSIAGFGGWVPITVTRYKLMVLMAFYLVIWQLLVFVALPGLFDLRCGIWDL